MKFDRTVDNQKSREKDEEWEFLVKMMIIIKTYHDNLPAGCEEKAGHNAI